MSWCCYDIVIMLLWCCYDVVIMLLWCCYDVVMMLLWYYSSVLILLLLICRTNCRNYQDRLDELRVLYLTTLHEYQCHLLQKNAENQPLVRGIGNGVQRSNDDQLERRDDKAGETCTALGSSILLQEGADLPDNLIVDMQRFTRKQRQDIVQRKLEKQVDDQPSEGKTLPSTSRYT